MVVSVAPEGIRVLEEHPLGVDEQHRPHRRALPVDPPLEDLREPLARESRRDRPAARPARCRCPQNGTVGPAACGQRLAVQGRGHQQNRVADRDAGRGTSARRRRWRISATTRTRPGISSPATVSERLFCSMSGVEPMKTCRRRSWAGRSAGLATKTQSGSSFGGVRHVASSGSCAGPGPGVAKDEAAHSR